MFEDLTHRLEKVFSLVRSKGSITTKDIESTLKEIRTVLLEADVSLGAIASLEKEVRTRAFGQKILKSLRPGQLIVKIVHDEIAVLLGGERTQDEEESLQSKLSKEEKRKEVLLYESENLPTVYMLMGLQGSGKTTSAGKLAFRLLQQRKKVLVVSADVYRPAAREQLQKVAQRIGADAVSIVEDEKPLAIIERALQQAKLKAYDVLLIDTAGRLHIDKELMGEIQAIHKLAKPHEVLFVADGLMGQDAAKTAKEFQKHVPMTGIILTRMDGDARGGAALSIVHAAKQPIKFIGVGEKSEQLEVFHPSRMADRILNMGDVVSLVERIQETVNKEEGEKLVKRIKKGVFDMNDMEKQLAQMSSMGGVSGVLSFLPGVRDMKKKMQEADISDKTFVHQRAIIASMTKRERENPDLIDAPRKRRIARGAGVDISQVNRLLKLRRQMADVFKAMKQKKGLPGFSGLGGLMGMMGPGSKEMGQDLEKAQSMFEDLASVQGQSNPKSDDAFTKALASLQEKR